MCAEILDLPEPMTPLQSRHSRQSGPERKKLPKQRHRYLLTWTCPGLGFGFVTVALYHTPSPYLGMTKFKLWFKGGLTLKLFVFVCLISLQQINTALFVQNVKKQVTWQDKVFQLLVLTMAGAVPHLIASQPGKGE